MAFRLLPDGSLQFDTLDDALSAQAALIQRRDSSAAPKKTSKTKVRTTGIASPPIRSGTLNVSRLPLPINLTPIQREVLLSVAHRDEIDFAGLKALHPTAAKDIGKFMKALRELCDAAGYTDGEMLSRKVVGFGPNKKALYSPGPSLLSALE